MYFNQPNSHHRMYAVEEIKRFDGLHSYQPYVRNCINSIIYEEYGPNRPRNKSLNRVYMHE